ELKWITLTNKQKSESLLSILHYNPHQFRRLLDLVKDYIRTGRFEEANRLVEHYFDIFDDSAHIGPEELSRIPDLFRVSSGIHSEFWAKAADRLCVHAVREPYESFTHLQVINALTSLTRVVGAFEDFDLIHKVGQTLEGCYQKNPNDHTKCCSEALPLLM